MFGVRSAVVAGRLNRGDCCAYIVGNDTTIEVAAALYRQAGTAVNRIPVVEHPAAELKLSPHRCLLPRGEKVRLRGER